MPIIKGSFCSHCAARHFDHNTISQCARKWQKIIFSSKPIVGAIIYIWCIEDDIFLKTLVRCVCFERIYGGWYWLNIGSTLRRADQISFESAALLVRIISFWNWLTMRDDTRGQKIAIGLTRYIIVGIFETFAQMRANNKSPRIVDTHYIV